MKRISGILFLALIAVISAAFPVSVSGAPAKEAGASFKDAEMKDWILLELRKNGETVRMDRQKLAANEMGGVYAIYFQDGRLSGLGAPNRYHAPYSTGANRSITIGNIASTMMFSFLEPDGLKEHDFFNYLSGAQRWDLWNGKLELYCSSSGGGEVILVFIEK